MSARDRAVASVSPRPSHIYGISVTLNERRRGDGSGLGLAIAQAYARAHGREIVYEPAVPRGARFEFVLPFRTEGNERPRAASG